MYNRGRNGGGPQRYQAPRIEEPEEDWDNPTPANSAPARPYQAEPVGTGSFGEYEEPMVSGMKDMVFTRGGGNSGSDRGGFNTRDNSSGFSGNTGGFRNDGDRGGFGNRNERPREGGFGERGQRSDRGSSSRGSFRGSEGGGFSRDDRSSNGFVGGGRSDGGGGDDTAVEKEIPARYTGLVIGRGGTRIRELQESSGARINVDKSRTDVCVITLRGSEAARCKADRLIEELMEEDQKNSGSRRSGDNQSRPSGGFGEGESTGFGGDRRGNNDGAAGGNGRGFNESSDETTAELQVPSSAVGRIIGKGGSKIKDLREMSGARINIPDRNPDSEFIILSISGSEAARAKAKELIDELLEQDQSRSSRNDDAGGRSGGFGGQGGNSGGFGERNGFGETERESVPSTFGSSNSGGEAWNGDKQDSSKGGFGTNNTENGGGGGGFGNSRGGFGSSNGGTTNDTKPKVVSDRYAPINWKQAFSEDAEYQKIKWKNYPELRKDFYVEDQDVANMTPNEVKQMREENNKIMVHHFDEKDASLFPIPNPVRTFSEAYQHYPDILKELKRAGFEKPSPIQMQAWPILLKGHDLIGIAQTGTGKTLAFILPAFIHIEGQTAPRGKRGGPNVLVLSPTRELALQIEEEIKKKKVPTATLR